MCIKPYDVIYHSYSLLYNYWSHVLQNSILLVKKTNNYPLCVEHKMISFEKSTEELIGVIIIQPSIHVLRVWTCECLFFI